eukprot:6553751-Prymnesium_polylepis.1
MGIPYSKAGTYMGTDLPINEPSTDKPCADSVESTCRRFALHKSNVARIPQWRSGARGRRPRTCWPAGWAPAAPGRRPGEPHWSSCALWDNRPGFSACRT